MNPDLDRLQPYPFQKLAALFREVTPNPAYRPINLHIGEPKHATPQFIKDTLAANLGGLANYPTTAGSDALRGSIADWLQRRYGLPALDVKTQVLPVNGSREALFAFAQTVVNRTRDNPAVICPNPFYQIYEGAALLAGATPHFLNTLPNGYGKYAALDNETRHARSPDGTTSHSTRPPKDGSQVAGYLPSPLPVMPSPQSSDETTSHSTRLSKDDSQVAGYPASGRGSKREMQSLISAGEGDNVSLREFHVDDNYALNFDQLPQDVWQRAQLIYVCSPGNPTGHVMPLEEWKTLFELSDRYGFVIASDECYSEIYFDTPPLGALQAAQQRGRSDYKNLVVFSSLSKRSNVPGMRSGFVAGDAKVLEKFTLYRTYHGCAMNPAVQAASTAAWQDEEHVTENRRLYAEKFSRVIEILKPVLPVTLPDAGFYLWLRVPVADTTFAQHLYRDYNVSVLPGSFLAREAQGMNPGKDFVRIALVAELNETLEAARRIVEFSH